ncbi:MAG: transposase [Gammaproteobacteria bacterium]
MLTLKTPYREGTTHSVRSPLEFMQRLAALVPRPRLPLIRFHGVLAPNARLRSAIVLSPPVNATNTAEVHRNSAHHCAPACISWARLLKRVFGHHINCSSHR